MARKKKKTLSPLFVDFLKVTFLTLLVLGLAIFVCRESVDMVLHSDYFKVRKITIDPSLKLISEKDFDPVRNTSIFKVDLQTLHQRLRRKYPQVAELKIMRTFPNEIQVLAKERQPFAQWAARKALVTVDENGYVISLLTKRDDLVPLIVGIDKSEEKVSLGSPVAHNHVQTGLRILKLFRLERGLAPFQVAEINVEQLSKIVIKLDTGLIVIMDWDDIKQKLNMLSEVLAELQMDMDLIEYVDMRFSNPTIGKKE